MSAAQIHYELFVRKGRSPSWTLELASEDRGQTVKLAEDMLADGRAVAVRVTKEVLDPDSREFKSVTILSKGEPEKKKEAPTEDALEPLCVSPQDLYTVHARERIGRLLEPWLGRHRVTPFELLHRPDLIEKLDASGLDLQHAIQKVAIPEAQARSVRVHEVIRSYQKLVQSAIDRVITDARKRRLPRVGEAGFGALAESLAGEPERAYLLGAAVADHIGEAASWPEKIARLLDLADAAPAEAKARALVFHVLEEPLSEALGARGPLTELLGERPDLGSTLGAMTRLAAADRIDALAAAMPAVARIAPPLAGAAARLANWLDGTHFAGVRRAIARRVLKELSGPRRLKPDDPEGEIIALRALAMALTAAAERLIPIDEVQRVFSERSRMLVRPDFVESYVGTDRSAQGELEALLWLAENVTGAANKRSARDWILSRIGSLRFETTLRQEPGSIVNKLAGLAELQRGLPKAGFAADDVEAVAVRLGEIGGMIEADARLTAGLAKSNGPTVTRLAYLLRLAAGEAAPLGPAADRARAEALRLLKSPQARIELAQEPAALGSVRDLLKSAGLAA